MRRTESMLDWCQRLLLNGALCSHYRMTMGVFTYRNRYQKLPSWSLRRNLWAQ
jgi:hypothetical protein